MTGDAFEFRTASRSTFTLNWFTFYTILSSSYRNLHYTAMTKRFHTQKNLPKFAELSASCVPHVLNQDGEEITLLEAIKAGMENVARHILLEKQFFNLERQDKRKDGTSLFWATAKGFEDIVELLIWNGAQIVARNKNGCTPLHAACDGNHLALARMLLKWGAPIDITSKNGDSCLHIACVRGHFTIAKLLLEKGTKSAGLKNNNGKTPSQVAEANEQWEIANLIKDHLNKTNHREESVVRRTRSRDLSRKRSSRDLDDDFDGFEKIKLQHGDRSESRSPKRPPSMTARGDRSSFKRYQKRSETETATAVNEGVKTRSRNKETKVKALDVTESTPNKDARKSCTCKLVVETTDSSDYTVSSIFRPYMNRSRSVASSIRRSTNLRLQSMPYASSSDQMNDLNKS